MKKITKNTTKLPMHGKVKRGFRFYCSMVMPWPYCWAAPCRPLPPATPSPAGGIVITFAKEILTLITG